MSAAKENPCRKFQANIFNKSKCQNCFKPRESHLLNDEDLTQVSGRGPRGCPETETGPRGARRPGAPGGLEGPGARTPRWALPEAAEAGEGGRAPSAPPAPRARRRETAALPRKEQGLPRSRGGRGGGASGGPRENKKEQEKCA